MQNEKTPSESPKNAASEETPSAPKIPVAFCITELAPGGAEKALFQLVAELNRNRFAPTVYAISAKPRDLENSLVPLFRELGVETLNLGAKSARDLPRVFWRLRRELKARQTLILQAFLFHANLLGRFAARAAGVPVVCSGVRVAERDAPRRLKLDRLTRSFCDLWICVGNSVAEFTATVGGIPAEKVVSIPNGVRLRRDVSPENGGAELVFSPADRANETASNAEKDGVKTNVANDLENAENQRGAFPPEPFGRRKRILCVGRLTRQKGFDWLLENARRWLTPEVARDWEIWIVGDGEEKDALRQIVERNGLADDVFFAGRRSDAPRLLAESEIFAAPSRWEGMSNALLEAAAAGKPVVCSNVEGVAEILGDSAEPQSCAFGDANAWTEKISALIADEGKRSELGRKNRERVLAEFTVEKAARKYEEIWLKLLERKSLKRGGLH